LREWLDIFRRAVAATRRDNMTMVASALAYSAFFTIPSALLLAVGAFTLTTGPGTIDRLLRRLEDVVPKQATDLLGASLHQLDRRPAESAALVALGLLLALWSTTGAMTAYMTGINIVYGRRDSRGFVRRRLIALGMVACIASAVILTAVFLIFGSIVERQVGDALGISRELAYLWWLAQWPILIGGLLAAFATLLWLGPDLDRRLHWRFLSAGSIVAVLAWLTVSGGLAVYTSSFGSFNKTWGTLSAVIVTLTWLWLSGLSLLFGAELNAEVERSRGAGRREQL
jgi:membrane protein